MTNNTINNVPRGLLDRAWRALANSATGREIGAYLDAGHCAPECAETCTRASVCATCSADLSAPSPAGVDGLEVVGVRVTSDGFGSYIADSAMGMPATFPGEVREPLCRLSSASSIIIGLQEKIERLQFSLEVAKTDELSAAVYAETESIKHSLWDTEKERDQQAQRIGELEGLLREVHDTYRGAIHWEDLRGTMKRIDAAIYAGKEDAK